MLPSYSLPSLSRTLSTQSILTSCDYTALSWQNAALLSTARHLSRATNVRAKLYYQTAFIGDQLDEMDVEPEQSDFEPLLEMMELAKGLKELAEIHSEDPSLRNTRERHDMFKFTYLCPEIHTCFVNTR